MLLFEHVPPLPCRETTRNRRPVDRTFGLVVDEEPFEQLMLDRHLVGGQVGQDVLVADVVEA